MQVDTTAQQYQPLTGLTGVQAEAARKDGRGNAQALQAGRSIGQILLGNFFTWFNILNFLLAAALLWVRSYRNLMFMGVVLANTLISTIQEIRAKRTVDKLTLLAQAPIAVLRDGKWAKLAPDQLVQDDVVRLATGDQVCADALVLEGQGAANESLLTGESEPVAKAAGDALFSGSYLTEGTLTARLQKVGKDSYAGQLVQSVRKVKVVRSRLMDDLRKLIRFVSYFLLPIGLALFVKQFFFLKDPLEKSVSSTAAAILGMIPEGLMLLTSMTLAVGVIRLGKQKTLVQELYGIENLARVDTLCVDKTGTITRGCLRLEKMIPWGPATAQEIETELQRLVAASGDENATFNALRQYCQPQPGQVVQASARIPFSSARKWSALSFANQGTWVLGAPDFVLPGTMGRDLAALVNQYADEGYRVLLLAASSQQLQGQQLPAGLVARALLLLNDEIREDFAQTAAFLRREGVGIKVISGDNPRTVAEVARRAGLENAGQWVDATTLDSDEKLQQAADRYTVFGRVTPEQKKELVLALKRQGHTTAMMGDGVNDVPALKVCDCAIAMAGGSDAARKVSQLTLLDENFSALPAVILEGRRVINNITRSASLFLVKTCFSYLLALLMLALPFSYPFRPIQLTLISTFTVGIPSFILALEPNRERVKEGFLQTILQNALPGALTNLILLGILFFASRRLGFSQAEYSTIAVAAVGATGLFVLAYTSRPVTFLRILLLGIMLEGMQTAAIFFPSFFFLTQPSFAGEILLLGLIACAPVLLLVTRWLLGLAFARIPRPAAPGCGQAA